MPSQDCYRFKRAAWSGTIAVVLLITACGRQDTPGTTGPSTQPAGTPVVTAPVTSRSLGTEIEAVGTARANESVDVTSKSSNIVTAIHFKDGDFVRRGAVLVELDSAEARATLAEAQAALADSESQFNRSRELYAQKALSVSQLEQIEATLKGNRARVNAADARLADTVIRAGFDGRTGFRRVSVGSLISPGTVITTLDDASVIKLDFTVPETYFYLLKTGLPVTAKSAGLPNRSFEGKVTNIDSRIDPVTRSLTVRAEIPNRDGLLRPGMFMTVALQGNVTPTLLVPEAAIIPEQGRMYVLVVDGNVAHRREVMIGRRRPGEVEIVNGLQEGERVVVEGTQNLRDGDAVREDAPGTAVSS
ncbi:efflux RND transporter periplasmic adaptor subunit [Povalibacter sp.]|uniref:efflux RND transporter periplasmic adaptor subunit n=1 Tax=Povalibacter sp. TaxID=1962978 RepID=UPI002F3E74BA